MRHILTNKIVLATILLILTTTSLYSQEKAYTIELPDGATARLGKGRIYNLRYTVDGGRIVVSTSLGIMLYDTINFNEIYLISKHARWASHLTMNPDGKSFATVDENGKIQIWDVDSGKHLKQLNNVVNVSKMNFSRDGRTLSILEENGSVLLLDTNTRKKNHEFKDILDPKQVNPWTVSINPSNFVIASGNDNGIVSIYDPFSGESKEMPKLNVEELVYSLTFNHDGSLLASRSNSEVRIWHPETAELRQKIDIHPVGGRIAFSPDGNLIANYTYSGDIQLYDVKTGKKYRSYDQHTAFINTVDFSSDMRTLASASEDGSIRIYNILTGQQIHAIHDYIGDFTCIDVSPDGKTIVAPSLDLNTCLWDVETGNLAKLFYRVRHNPFEVLAVDPTGEYIAATEFFDATIYLHDIETGQFLKSLEGHEERIVSIKFNPDGKTIASGSNDNTVRIWDVKTLTVKHVLNGHTKDVTCVEFSPDGTTIASGSTDQRTILWDANTGDEKHVLAGHETDIVSLSFSPDGSKIASVALSSEVFLWNVSSGKLDKVMHVSDSTISSVLFHPNGKVVAIGRDTGDVELIDIESEKSLHKFSGHLGQIKHLVFASESTKLVSLSDDGVIYVWNVAGR